MNKLKNFQTASENNSVYAILIKTLQKGWYNPNCFTSAARLRPFLNDQAFLELMFYYGNFLLAGSFFNTDLFWEGLSCMKQSGLLTIKSAQAPECERFKNEPQEFYSFYTRVHDDVSGYFDLQG